MENSKPILISKVKLADSLSDPVFINDFGQLYYLCDRDPTASEPDCYTDFPNFRYMWFNTTTSDMFWCLDCTSDAMIWVKLSVMPLDGEWQINTSRSYDLPTVAFNTARQPNLTNDVEVTVICSLTSALIVTAEVQLKISTDGTTYNTLAQESLSGLVTTDTRTLYGTVPAGSYYKLVNSSGTATIVNISELIM